MNFIKNHTQIFVATLFVFLLFGWFAPEPSSASFLQVDFWLLWLFAMSVVTLPFVYLEVALAKRSKKSAVSSMPELTRAADANTYWRMVSWLGAAALSLVAVGFANFALGYTESALFNHGYHFDVHHGLLVLAAVVIAFALSYLEMVWLALAGVVLAFVAIALSGINPSSNWQMTGTSLSEWLNAFILALVATGFGLGVYWQLSLNKANAHKSSLWLALPIWLVQVLAGCYFALFQGVDSEFASMLYGIAMLLGSAVSLKLLKTQLSTLPSGIFVFIAFVAGALSLWSMVSLESYARLAVVALSLFSCLILALFAGWQMKISHLRKALQFDSELAYNIWRVAIRLVVPFCILLALVALVSTLLT